MLPMQKLPRIGLTSCKAPRAAMIADESSVPNGDLVADFTVVSLNKKESAIDDAKSSQMRSPVKSCRSTC